MRLSLAYSSTFAMRSMLRMNERWMRTKRAGSSVRFDRAPASDP